MAVHESRINITAGENAKPAFDRVAGYLRELRLEARRSGEMQLERVLSSPRGLIGAGLQAAGLGIASVITDRIGEAFKTATEKAVEMRKQIQEGTANAADMANEMAKSLPILGGFVSGFENVRELLTGEKAELEAINEEAKTTLEYYNAQTKSVTETRKIQQEQLAIIKAIKNETALAAMPASEREEARIGMAHDKFVDDERKKLEEAKTKAMDPDTAKTRANFVKQLRAAQAEAVTRIQEIQSGEAVVTEGRQSHAMSESEKAHAIEMAQAQAKSIQKAINQIDEGERQRKGQAEIDFQNVTAADAIKTQVEQAEAHKKIEKQQWDEISADRRKAEEEERERVQKGIRETTEAKFEQQQIADAAAKAQSELRQKELKENGDALDAELEAIRESYRVRIRDARSAEEQQGLIKSEAADERAAEEKDRDRQAKEDKIKAEQEAAEQAKSGPKAQGPMASAWGRLSTLVEAGATHGYAAASRERGGTHTQPTLAEQQKQTGLLEEIKNWMKGAPIGEPKRIFPGTSGAGSALM